MSRIRPEEPVSLERGGSPAVSPAPRWELSIEPGGQLTAELAGTDPPIRVTGDDLADVRKQIRTLITRALM
jgi:hypothetical protein